MTKKIKIARSSKKIWRHISFLSTTYRLVTSLHSLHLLQRVLQRARASGKGKERAKNTSRRREEHFAAAKYTSRCSDLLLAYLKSRSRYLKSRSRRRTQVCVGLNRMYAHGFEISCGLNRMYAQTYNLVIRTRIACNYRWVRISRGGLSESVRK